MTARAFITLVPRDGKLDMLTEYEGGFDGDNIAHLAAVATGQHLASMLDEDSHPVNLTAEQIAAVKAQHAGLDAETSH